MCKNIILMTLLLLITLRLCVDRRYREGLEDGDEALELAGTNGGRTRRHDDQVDRKVSNTKHDTGIVQKLISTL